MDKINVCASFSPLYVFGLIAVFFKVLYTYFVSQPVNERAWTKVSESLVIPRFDLSAKARRVAHSAGR